jgi:formylglycine-generating enzyme required for sulfatase activity
LKRKKEEHMQSMKKALLLAAAVSAVGAAWAVPVVSNVQMTQRAGTRWIDVTYDLSGEAAVVTLGIETNGVPLPGEAVERVSGDVSAVVQPGTGKHIAWNAGVDWPEHLTDAARARVTAWSPDAPPRYCAVDLAEGYSAASWPVYYYESAGAVPNGVTNDLYKTTRLLLRRCDPTGAGGFKMGSPSTEIGRSNDEYEHDVILTKGFYIGVYEVTQGQWQLAMGDKRSWPSKWGGNDWKRTRPVERVSWWEIRENPGNTDDTASDWPSNRVVHTDSFMGRLRAKTGIGGFDLPTEAQWEYACRAGTDGALNDGTPNLTNILCDARADALGRYQSNGGRILVDSTWTDPDIALGINATNVTPAYATAKVGSYQPNGWGLYDMSGNVFEWCLDWYGGNLGSVPVTDPVGVASGGSARLLRGGAWSYQADLMRSAKRHSRTPNQREERVGFRPAWHLP